MGAALALLVTGGTELFPQDRIVRSGCSKSFSNCVFNLTVRFGDGSAIGFRGDGEVVRLISAH
jgi:hypothetical protein